VLFDTAEIPWWAWVRRFHLPEAEKLNGRAAMVGYVLALFVDQLTGESQLGQVATRAERGLMSVPCVAGTCVGWHVLQVLVACRACACPVAGSFGL